jgi:hypothetical protein
MYFKAKEHSSKNSIRKTLCSTNQNAYKKQTDKKETKKKQVNKQKQLL